MPAYPDDRNIVRATSNGVRMDVAYGSSNDDFDYADWGTTVSHQDLHARGKKLGVKVIFQGGHAEVQWAHGDGFMSEHSLDAVVNINADNGAMSFPFWSLEENGDQRCPFWVEFTHTGLKVYHYEGDPGDDADKYLVFDSNTIHPD